MEILHIYLRVSSQIQVDNTSLKTQSDVGIELSKKLGMGYEIHNEGGSSSFSDNLDSRPVLSNIIRRISNGEIKSLYSWNPDRLSRNQTVWIQIRSYLIRYGVILYTSNGKYDSTDYLENLLLGIISEITSYDNSLRQKRFVDARISRVKEGKFHGGLPLFSYKINKTNQGSTLEENPEESKWVRFVYESYLNGWSTTEIKQHLEENNVKTRRGNSHWSLGSLQLMLRNKSYLGDVSFFEKKSKKTYHYKIPQIISHQLFEKVQDKRMGILNVKGQYRKTIKSYLFRDFLVCSCGHRMGGRTSENHYVQHYYCPLNERKFNKSKKEDLSCSMKRCLNIPQTEEFLWNSIIEILKNTISIKEKFNEYLKESGRLDKRQLNLFISQKTKELEELNEVKSKLEEGIIDVERKNYMGEFQSENIYKTLKKQLNKEHLSISSKIDSIQSTLTSLGSESHWYDVIDHLNELINEDDQLSQPKKKELLRSIIDHIKVDYDNTNKTHGLEVNFRIPMRVFSDDSNLKPKTLRLDYSTVREFSLTQEFNTPKITQTRTDFLIMTVQLTSSNLWMSPYSSHQTELYHIIKTQHEDGEKNFKQISDWLNEHGYKTTRGKVFTQGHVWSMYKKKKKSNERFGREFVPNFKSISIDILDSSPVQDN
jgi:DNA invertase Pin-like site-specific DNA recombinase